MTPAPRRADTVHVAGAGLSGLACAVRASAAGARVVLHEAAAEAGGRARSFRDDATGRLIDNGSHLLLGANRAARTYLAETGASALLVRARPAGFPFRDLATGETWLLRPGPLMPASPSRGVPGARPLEPARDALRLARAGRGAAVADVVDPGSVLFARLWRPLCLAVLNADADEASARLLWRVVRRTLLKGEAAWAPMHFPEGLSAALVAPAIGLLRARGAEIRLNARLRGVARRGRSAAGLVFADRRLPLAPDDSVVLALPARDCNRVWPEAGAPEDSRAVVNAHFRLAGAPAMPWGAPFLGLSGGAAHWLFRRGDLLSATASAADRLLDLPAAAVARLLWDDARRAVGLAEAPPPPFRVVKERRATFAQTPAQAARRPGARTALDNLFLAGDWTDTGLPATIEGAVRSGFAAARLAVRRRRGRFDST